MSRSSGVIHLTQDELRQVLLENGIVPGGGLSEEQQAESRVDIPADDSINQDVLEPTPFSANTWLNIIVEASKPVLWSAAYNYVRDDVWAPLTQKLISYTGYSDPNDPNAQMIGQLAYGTAAMLGLFALKFGITYAIYKMKNKPIDSDFKKEIYTDAKTIAAASLSIITWDLAASAGIKFYTGRGYDAITAGYYAAWTPGPAEGVTQYVVPKLVDGLVDLLTTREGTKNFFSSPVVVLKNMLRLTAGVGVNATLGGIPGDVWQLVYNRCLEKGYSPEVTATLVSLAVGGCNIIYGVSYNIADKKFFPPETTEKKDQLAGSSIAESAKVTLHGQSSSSLSASKKKSDLPPPIPKK